MPRSVLLAVYIVAMIVIIVGLDILFFRDQFWPRLIVNVGVVLVFIAFYFKFFD